MSCFAVTHQKTFLSHSWAVFSLANISAITGYPKRGKERERVHRCKLRTRKISHKNAALRLLCIQVNLRRKLPPQQSTFSEFEIFDHTLCFCAHRRLTVVPSFFKIISPLVAMLSGASSEFEDGAEMREADRQPYVANASLLALGQTTTSERAKLKKTLLCLFILPAKALLYHYSLSRSRSSFLSSFYRYRSILCRSGPVPFYDWAQSKTSKVIYEWLQS